MSATSLAIQPRIWDWQLAQSKARPIIKRILRRHLDDVEDVLQEAVLKALKAQDTFMGRCQFTTWYTRIAMNSALMRLRNYRAKSLPGSLEAISRDGELLIATVFTKPVAFDNVWQEELKRLLQEEIAKLPALLRQEAACFLDEDFPLCNNTRKSRKFRMLRDLRPRVRERLGVL